MSRRKGPTARFLTDNNRLNDRNKRTTTFEIGFDDHFHESTRKEQRNDCFAYDRFGISAVSKDLNDHFCIPDCNRLKGKSQTVKESIEKTRMRQMINCQEN